MALLHPKCEKTNKFDFSLDNFESKFFIIQAKNFYYNYELKPYQKILKIQMKAKFSSHIDFIPDADDPMYHSMVPCLLER